MKDLYDSIPLDCFEGEENTESWKVEAFSALSEKNLVPHVGNYLGLDVSKDSTGICLYSNGVKKTTNVSLEYDSRNPHAEVLARNSLKSAIMRFCGVMDYDAIVIEDVFEGNNPYTTRMLYALNTAIDELIVDGIITCKDFCRVSNQTWKSWLVSAGDPEEVKGLNDKLKVQLVLKKLGVIEEGTGFQDRLDATGMLLGYFINSRSASRKEVRKSEIRVSFSDILYAYEEDDDLVKLSALGEDDSITTVFVDDSKMSKKKMIDYLSRNPRVVYITSKPISLGLLAGELGLWVTSNGKGYFGFWLKGKARERYIRKLEGRA